MRRPSLFLIAACLGLALAACTTNATEPQPAPAPQAEPDIVFYDGSGAMKSDLIMDGAYQFPEWDITPGFDLSYTSGYDGRTTNLRINDGSMTYGDVVKTYDKYYGDDDYVAQNEYIEILGFSAVCVTEDTLTYETKHTFSRSDVYIEEAESFDIIYSLSVPVINGYKTTDFDRMLDVLGRPRFADVSWLDEDSYEITYWWDMGNDRYLRLLPSGGIRWQTGEFLCQSRPMFEPFLKGA